jgi:hypothetical protein
MLQGDTLLVVENKKVSAEKRSAGRDRPSPALSDPCLCLPIEDWRKPFDAAMQGQALAALEEGRVLLFPKLSFTLTRSEGAFLRPDCLGAHAQPIRFAEVTRRLEGVQEKEKSALVLAAMMMRYAETTRDFIARLLPAYMPHLLTGDTGFWPPQGKPNSTRAERYRMQVDAFPFQPTGGKRLLRVFTHLDGHDPCVWRFGEPFENVIARFLPRLGAPVPGAALLLRLMGRTPRLRTPYDHYMLALQAMMKRSVWYQAEGPQATVYFPTGSTWMMFADQVPHADVSGQHMLEQTFLIAPEALEDPGASPLAIMQRLMRRKLA